MWHFKRSWFTTWILLAEFAAAPFFFLTELEEDRDFSYPINQDLTLQAGYGYEDLEDPVNPQIEGGSVVWGKISWD